MEDENGIGSGWYLPEYSNTSRYHYTANGKRSACGRFGTLGTTHLMKTIPKDAACKACTKKTLHNKS